MHHPEVDRFLKKFVKESTLIEKKMAWFEKNVINIWDYFTLK